MDIATILDKLQIYFENWGYITILVSSFIEISPLGWMIPGGFILSIAGFFANTDKQLNLFMIILSGTLGGWFTLLLAYYLGKKTNVWLIKKLHQEKNASFARSMLQKHGGVILTTSMMANLTRFWIAYVSGIDNYNFWKFAKFSFLASLGWASLMTMIGYFAGFGRGSIENLTRNVGVVAWLLLMVAVFILVKSAKHEHQHFKKDEPHNEDN